MWVREDIEPKRSYRPVDGRMTTLGDVILKGRCGLSFLNTARDPALVNVAT